MVLCVFVKGQNGIYSHFSLADPIAMALFLYHSLRVSLMDEHTMSSAYRQDVEA